MKTRTIQRSPDLGLRIRLQRLPEEAVPAPQAQPKPPIWLGWQDEEGKEATSLSARWDTPSNATSPDGYFPGVWVAVVDNAMAVEWDIEFTPKIWRETNGELTLAWEGRTVKLKRPSTLPDTPENLFDGQRVTLPVLTILEETVAPSEYWLLGGRGSEFPEVSMPTWIAAGNTLTVGQDHKSMSGTVVATATVGTQKVGSVTLDLVRVIADPEPDFCSVIPDQVSEPEAYAAWAEQCLAAYCMNPPPGDSAHPNPAWLVWAQRCI
ncbi:MAG: hypothetical protein V4858_09050 [Pseudomonadota bacterium]